MAITIDNLMKDSRDWDWVDEYEKKMGLDALCKYSRELFNYLFNLPDESEIVIADIVKKENEDLFAKCVCRYSYEGTLNLIFSADMTKLRKHELKKKEI